MQSDGATIIDGKAGAARVLGDVAKQVQTLRSQGVSPTLAVVLVGEDPASQVYVRNKEQRAKEVGIETVDARLPATATTDEVLERVQGLARDDRIHGILVQLPLPPGIQSQRILDAVPPRKDVDGFHPENLGLLMSGRPRFVACTPQGCLLLLQGADVPIRGRRALVIGRSTIVGQPMAQLLVAHDATVTIAHSKTVGLEDECRRADILVAAVGRPRMVSGAWIKPGAAVIDVGINRGVDGKLCGDVDFAEARTRAGWITPVPGGVGPMTIACLLRNVVQAASKLKDLR